ncbi:hypothetical protein DPEC_G00241770, partial [Dallia pectoralis]
CQCRSLFQVLAEVHVDQALIDLQTKTHFLSEKLCDSQVQLLRRRAVDVYHYIVLVRPELYCTRSYMASCDEEFICLNVEDELSPDGFGKVLGQTTEQTT